MIILKVVSRRNTKNSRISLFLSEQRNTKPRIAMVSFENLSPSSFAPLTIAIVGSQQTKKRCKTRWRQHKCNFHLKEKLNLENEMRTIPDLE